MSEDDNKVIATYNNNTTNEHYDVRINDVRTASDVLGAVIKEHDGLRLSQLEADVLRLASRVLHDVYMCAKFPDLEAKLITGGKTRKH